MSSNPKGLVPDRISVPNPDLTMARELAALQEGPPEKVVEGPVADPEGKTVTNTVEGVTGPEVEVQAPGRTTHGATNNP